MPVRRICPSGPCSAQRAKRAWTVVRLRRGAEVTDAEFVHKLRDERRTFVAHELLPDREFNAQARSLALEQRSFERGVTMHRYAIGDVSEASPC